MEPEKGSDEGRPPKQRPGRPRHWADPRGDTAEWLAGLSPTAIRITDIAKELLVSEGVDSVTLERVALEANVDRSTLRYNFPNKYALLHATYNRLQVEAWNQLIERLRDVEPLQDRVRAYIRECRGLVADRAAGQGYAELLPLGVRDPMLRGWLNLDYEFWEHDILELTGLDAMLDDELTGQRMHTCVVLIIAVVGGLVYRSSLDLSFDSGPVLDMLADMVVHTLFDE